MADLELNENGVVGVDNAMEFLNSTDPLMSLAQTSVDPVEALARKILQVWLPGG
jgi:hypothetical protein